MTTTKTCEIPLLGTVWFNKKSIANIISLSDMMKRFRVTMDSLRDKALLVHLPDKVVRFKEMKNGLYALNPNDKSSYIPNNKLQLVNTIKENLSYLSPQQEFQAKRARKLFQAMRMPTAKDLKGIT